MVRRPQPGRLTYVRLIYNAMMGTFFAEVSVDTVTFQDGVATVAYVHATLGRDDDDVFLCAKSTDAGSST